MLKPFLAAVLLLATPHLVTSGSSQVVPIPPTQLPGPPPAPALPPAPPPATDIYELTFDGKIDSLKAAKPVAIAAEPGYENQPFFTPDGAAILFTANRDGKSTDIFEWDRKSRRATRLTSTGESEYSPAITPDGKGMSVIRVEADGTQRLWWFDRSGSNPRVILSKVQPVGYHAWVNSDELALFVLGKPSTLQHARVSTGAARTVAENIGRSLHRIPGTQAVSFIHRETDSDVWVKRFEPATRAVTRLVRLPEGNTERDVAWTPDATLLMSAGTRIHSWRPGTDGWRDVYDVAAHALGVVTRIAVAPDGRSMAIVVNEPAR